MAWGGSTPAVPVAEVNETTFAGTVASGSFTPTGDALLVAFCYAHRAGGNTNVSSIASTFSLANSWVLANDGATDAKSQYTGGSTNPVIEIWVAQAASSPGAGTVTVTYDVSCPSRSLYLVEIDSGFASFASLVAQCDNGTATTTTSPGDTFGSAPSSDSLLLSFLACVTTSFSDLTPVSGWTEVYEFAGANIHRHTQYADGDNGSGYSWTGIGGTPSEQVYAALEIGAEAAAASASPGIEVVRTIPGVAH